MSKIDGLVQDFFAHKRIAVVSVSDEREIGCNLDYRKFKEARYSVSAVNPRITAFEGDPCYPDLQSIPPPPQGKSPKSLNDCTNGSAVRLES